MILRTRAPAKINLTLHVVRRRVDGHHDLESLVAFAGVADIVELTPGGELALDVVGPTAAAAGRAGDNLVLRAARALAERVPGLVAGRFRLVKRLPVGAGIGGGSSDAAAALRLLAQANGLDLTDERVRDAARVTGADVPVCVEPRSRVMRGTGDVLGPPLRWRGLCAVLVNPAVHLATATVFGRMGLKPGQINGLDDHPAVSHETGRDAVLVALAGGRNDMEGAARGLAPVIDDVLSLIAATPDCRLARMSGSGSTCFGLFASRRAALSAAAAIRDRRPEWWVRATALG